MITLSWENVGATSRQRLQVSQQLYGLCWQWNRMRLTLLFFGLCALHFHTRDCPKSGIEVHLSPFHSTQISRPLIQQRCQQKRSSYGVTAFVDMHCPQQFAKPLWLNNGWEVCSPVRRQSVLQPNGDITLSVPRRGQPVAPNLTAQHQGPICRLHGATLFNFLKCRQQLHWLNAGHLPVTNPRE